MSRHIHIHRHARDDREPDQSDLNAAARGLNMIGKSVSELEDIVREHQGKAMFASKAIVAAAKQIIAAKRRMGARDAGDIRIIYNKLLGGWYVVRGPHQAPLNGRFNSKEEAEAYLARYK